MKYLKLYEGFIKLIKESFDFESLSQFGFTEDDINTLKKMSKNKKYQIFKKIWYEDKSFKEFYLNNQDKFIKFFKFKCKDIPDETIKYWNRPEKVEHH